MKKLCAVVLIIIAFSWSSPVILADNLSKNSISYEEPTSDDGGVDQP